MADRPTIYLSNWASHRTPGGDEDDEIPAAMLITTGCIGVLGVAWLTAGLLMGGAR